MKTVSTKYVESLINFAPTDRARKMGFAESQLHGATAAFNMLHRNGIAYVADEVGMGKTYVALGVMALLRFQNPTARIMVVTPRENIQLKWIKEQQNFTRDNWQHVDNLVKTFSGDPVRPPIACGSIGELSDALRYREHADLFLRATSFSIPTSNSERRKRLRRQLKNCLPWIPSSLLNLKSPEGFRDMYGRVLNALMPDIDLLVVDEAHNFKHGFSEKVSNRNRVLGMALGHPRGSDSDCKWYRPRVKNVLLLSATPFEYDYSDLYRQLDVFGKASTAFRKLDSSESLSASLLNGDDEAVKREVVRRLLIRRVQYLKIAGKDYSKNMYRRDWREGGFENHDRPIELDDPKQRMIVGLVQKKVAETLGERKFNNSFQIGMLSSFESFIETVSRKRHQISNATEGEDENSVFDGNQDASKDEKRGADSISLERVVKSYRETFGKSMPHPKLDATALSLANAFDTGKKALIFVRRIATVTELKAKLDEIYDGWLHRKMVDRLPELQQRISELFDQYRCEKTSKLAPVLAHDEEETQAEDRMLELSDDGGNDSFFAWFFRGFGPNGVLSGAAFQKNRLTNVSSVYATMFEDNHVGSLLDYPIDVYATLCETLFDKRGQVGDKLRHLAYRYFRGRTHQQSGYPRLYVFESYQYAGLKLVAERLDETGSKASAILNTSYHTREVSTGEIPKGFPMPEGVLNSKTFFTELVKRRELRARIWPKIDNNDYSNDFREQEQRRLLLSTMARLGAAYIDLYLLAIKQLGTFELRAEAAIERPEEKLIHDYLELLDQQCKSPSQFHAFYELSNASETFELLIAVNFPKARTCELSELARTFAQALQHQEPVGRMSGGVNKRMVMQFRMPGYPLILPTTDVLQEGEDLHTFCRQVIHYGITWTPSAMEQRTGRVDRIGSLAQRNLDGTEHTPNDKELIQVYYPHLSDTVERLQVRRVLERLNEFMRLIHHDVTKPKTSESKLDMNREVLKSIDMPPRINGCLSPDFPVEASWLIGNLVQPKPSPQNVQKVHAFFKSCCEQLAVKFKFEGRSHASANELRGRIAIHKNMIVDWELRNGCIGHRVQPFLVSLRSQLTGHGTLVRFSSSVGTLKMNDDNVDRLYELQKQLVGLRVCVRPHRKEQLVSLECDRLFNSTTTQFEELADAFRNVVLEADRLELELLGSDEFEFLEA